MTSKPSATAAPVTNAPAPTLQSNATTPGVPGLETWSQSLPTVLQAKVSALVSGGGADDVLAFLVACANNAANRMPPEISALVLEAALTGRILSDESLASVKRYAPDGVEVPASLVRADTSDDSPTQPPSSSSATSANDGRLALLIGASAGGCVILAAGAVVLVAVRRARHHAKRNSNGGSTAASTTSSSSAFSATSSGSGSTKGSKGSFGAVGPFGSATVRRERKKELEERPTSFNKFTSFGRDLVAMMNPNQRAQLAALRAEKGALRSSSTHETAISVMSERAEQPDRRQAREMSI